jgi:anaerobic magnesium-protoporphyrin IX monomethyl ester cyclase
MRVALVGSDCEENLGLAMIAASLLEAGHQVQVVPFNDVCELEAVADAVLRCRPKVVGLGIQFQHRSADFLRLAFELRQRGFNGHITCGGQYPSIAWAEVLDNDPAVDSIVLHEGERSIVELCAALTRRESLSAVPGLALRQAGAVAVRTEARALCADLDTLPFAHRYREPTRHLGLAFRPVWGSRGCWGSCAFCAITTYYRDANAYGGGRKLRLRSVENLAEEMAALWHAEGDTTLFCFHDETLLLPRPADSLARLTELRRQLDALGVGQVGLIGKCRPDCVTPELAKELRRLGVFRMFVGVENGSQQGLDHLGRRTTLDQIEQTLAAYEAAGIFVCYNLLLFEPDGALDDVRGNIDFIRRHAHIPVNFCRAEPYHGTPLYHRVKDRGTLMGSHLGWDYRIHDDRVELAFRIAASVFRERNFDAEGVANRAMGLGYTGQLLRCFFNVNTVKGQRLVERVDQLLRDISLDSAKFLEDAVNIAETCDLADHDRITRETAMLGLRVSAHNRVSHAALDDVIADICAYVDAQPRTVQRISIPERARAVIERMTLAGCFAASLQACGGDTNDGGGPGGDAGTGGASSTGGTWMVVDMAPTTGGRTSTGASSTTGGMVYDMIPNTGGRGTGGTSATGGQIYGDGGAPTGGKGTATGGKASTSTKAGTGGQGDGGSIAGGRTSTNTGTRVLPGGATSDGGAYAGGRTSTGGFTSAGGGDSVPPTGGRTSTGTFSTTGGMVYDMIPNTGGRSAGGTSATGGMVLDGLPPTGGKTGTGGQGMGGFIVDCVVNAGGMGRVPIGSLATRDVPKADDEGALACTVDPAPPQCSSTPLRGQAVVENWRDSSPQRFVRSSDIALFDPPNIRLQAKAEARRVCVQVQSDEQNLTYRWESEGQIEGNGGRIYWTPANEDDALCVAARGQGGVAVATLRACDLQRA